MKEKELDKVGKRLDTLVNLMLVWVFVVILLVVIVGIATQSVFWCVVTALAGIAVPCRLIGVEHPLLAELPPVPIPCGEHTAGVVAPAEDGRGELFPTCPGRLLVPEIAHSGQIAV